MGERERAKPFRSFPPPSALFSSLLTHHRPLAAQPQRPQISAMPDSIAKAIAKNLDTATYEGYRLGFEAARDEAALLAEHSGQPLLAQRLRAMRPLPKQGERQ